MLTFRGDELNYIYDSNDPAKLYMRPNTEDTIFSRAVGALNEHFNPKQNVKLQR